MLPGMSDQLCHPMAGCCDTREIWNGWNAAGCGRRLLCRADPRPSWFPRFLGGSGCLAPADEARVTDDLLMLNNEVQLVLQDGDKSGVPSRIVGADDAHHPRPVQCRDLQPALVAEMDVRVVDGHARHAHPVVRPSPLPRPTTAPDIACKPTTPCQLRQSSSRSAGRVRERLYALDWSAPGVLRSPTGSFEPEGSSWPVATAASRQAGCTRRS